MFATMSDIPLEILERMLDFLNDDRAAFSSSAGNGSLHPDITFSIINGFRTSRGIFKFKANVYSFLSIVNEPNFTMLSSIRNVVLNVFTLELMKNVVEALQRSKTLTISFLSATRPSDPVSVAWIFQVLPDL